MADNTGQGFVIPATVQLELGNPAAFVSDVKRVAQEIVAATKAGSITDPSTGRKAGPQQTAAEVGRLTAPMLDAAKALDKAFGKGNAFAADIRKAVSEINRATAEQRRPSPGAKPIAPAANASARPTREQIRSGGVREAADASNLAGADAAAKKMKGSAEKTAKLMEESGDPIERMVDGYKKSAEISQRIAANDEKILKHRAKAEVEAAKAASAYAKRFIVDDRAPEEKQDKTRARIRAIAEANIDEERRRLQQRNMEIGYTRATGGDKLLALNQAAEDGLRRAVRIQQYKLDQEAGSAKSMAEEKILRERQVRAVDKEVRRQTSAADRREIATSNVEARRAAVAQEKANLRAVTDRDRVSQAVLERDKRLADVRQQEANQAALRTKVGQALMRREARTAADQAVVDAQQRRTYLQQFATTQPLAPDATSYQKRMAREAQERTAQLARTAVAERETQMAQRAAEIKETRDTGGVARLGQARALEAAFAREVSIEQTKADLAQGAAAEFARQKVLLDQLNRAVAAEVRTQQDIEAIAKENVAKERDRLAQRAATRRAETPEDRAGIAADKLAEEARRREIDAQVRAGRDVQAVAGANADVRRRRVEQQQADLAAITPADRVAAAAFTVDQRLATAQQRLAEQAALRTAAGERTLQAEAQLATETAELKAMRARQASVDAKLLAATAAEANAREEQAARVSLLRGGALQADVGGYGREELLARSAIMRRTQADLRRAEIAERTGQADIEAAAQRKLAEAKLRVAIQEQERAIFKEAARGSDAGWFQRVQSKLSPGRLPEEQMNLRQFIGDKFQRTAGYAVSGAALGLGMSAISQMLQDATSLEVTFVRLRGQMEGIGKLDAFPKVRDEIRAIATETGQAADKVGNMYSRLLGLDQNPEQATKDAAAAAKLMTVTGLDEKVVLQSLIPVQKAFGVSAEEVGDQVVAMGEKFGIPEDELTEFLGKTAVTAKNAGLSLKELVAVGSNMANSLGKPISSSSEAINKFFTLVENNALKIFDILRQNPATQPYITQMTDALGKGETGTALKELLEASTKMNANQKGQLLTNVVSKRESEEFNALMSNAQKILDDFGDTNDNVAGRLNARTKELQGTVAVTFQRIAAAFQALGDKLFEAGLADHLRLIGNILGIVAFGLDKVLSLIVKLNELSTIGGVSLLSLFTQIGVGALAVVKVYGLLAKAKDWSSGASKKETVDEKVNAAVKRELAGAAGQATVAEEELATQKIASGAASQRGAVGGLPYTVQTGGVSPAVATEGSAGGGASLAGLAGQRQRDRSIYEATQAATTASERKAGEAAELAATERTEAARVAKSERLRESIASEKSVSARLGEARAVEESRLRAGMGAETAIPLATLRKRTETQDLYARGRGFGTERALPTDRLAAARAERRAEWEATRREQEAEVFQREREAAARARSQAAVQAANPPILPARARYQQQLRNWKEEQDLSKRASTVFREQKRVQEEALRRGAEVTSLGPLRGPEARRFMAPEVRPKLDVKPLYTGQIRALDEMRARSVRDAAKMAAPGELASLAARTEARAAVAADAAAKKAAEAAAREAAKQAAILKMQQARSVPGQWAGVADRASLLAREARPGRFSSWMSRVGGAYDVRRDRYAQDFAQQAAAGTLGMPSFWQKSVGGASLPFMKSAKADAALAATGTKGYGQKALPVAALAIAGMAAIKNAYDDQKQNLEAQIETYKSQLAGMSSEELKAMEVGRTDLVSRTAKAVFDTPTPEDLKTKEKLYAESGEARRILGGERRVEPPKTAITETKKALQQTRETATQKLYDRANENTRQLLTTFIQDDEDLAGVAEKYGLTEEIRAFGPFPGTAKAKIPKAMNQETLTRILRENQGSDPAASKIRIKTLELLRSQGDIPRQMLDESAQLADVADTVNLIDESGKTIDEYLLSQASNQDGRLKSIQQLTQEHEAGELTDADFVAGLKARLPDIENMATKLQGTPGGEQIAATAIQVRKAIKETENSWLDRVDDIRTQFKVLGSITPKQDTALAQGAKLLTRDLKTQFDGLQPLIEADIAGQQELIEGIADPEQRRAALKAGIKVSAASREIFLKKGATENTEVQALIKKAADITGMKEDDLRELLTRKAATEGRGLQEVATEWIDAQISFYKTNAKAGNIELAADYTDRANKLGQIRSDFTSKFAAIPDVPEGLPSEAKNRLTDININAIKRQGERVVQSAYLAGDSVASATIAAREAADNYNDVNARIAAGDPSVKWEDARKAEADMIAGERTRADAVFNYAQKVRNRELIAANRDPVRENAVKMNQARAALAYARQQGNKDDAEDATQEIMQLEQDAAENALNIQRARMQRAMVAVAEDPTQLALKQLQAAELELANAHGDADREQKAGAVDQAQRNLQNTIAASLSADAQLAMQLANLRGDTVGAATVAAQEAKRRLDDAIAKGITDRQVLAPLEGAIAEANKQLYLAPIQKQISDLDYLYGLEQISLGDYIALLTTQRDAMVYDSQEYRDLNMKIFQLKKGAQQDLGWSIPGNLTLPTLYEARRASATTFGTPSTPYQDNRNIQVNIAVNGAQDPITVATQVSQALTDSLRGGSTYSAGIPVGSGA